MELVTEPVKAKKDEAKPAAKKADAVEDAKIVEAKPKKVAAKAGGATKAGAAKVAKKTNVGKKM